MSGSVKYTWIKPPSLKELLENVGYLGKGHVRDGFLKEALRPEIERGDELAEKINRQNFPLQPFNEAELLAAEFAALEDEQDLEEFEQDLRDAVFRGFQSDNDEPLQRFRALPEPWRTQIIRSGGGAAKEPLEDLVFSLAPEPERKSAVSRKHDRWVSVQTLRPLAEYLVHVDEQLAHIDPVACHLFGSSDDELLAIAEQVAQCAQARHIHSIENGGDGVHGRERSPQAIRRSLRRRINAAIVHASGLLKLVGGEEAKNGAIYVDHWTRDRWRDRVVKTENWLENKVLTNEEKPGLALPMLEVAAGKRKTRASMWYAIVLGVRDYVRRSNEFRKRRAAEMEARGELEMARELLEENLVPIFPTGTLPPEWHPNPRYGENAYDPTKTPREAVAELNKRWGRARALMRDQGVYFLGVRTVEPHEDGSPHMHLMLYVRARQVAETCRIIALQWPATTEDEATARKAGIYEGPAMKIQIWQDRSGKDAADPASYVMHYVMKSIDYDGETHPDVLAATTDTERQKAARQGARAVAWASTMNIRRISLVGFPQGTIGRWEAFFRELQSDDRNPCPHTRAILFAMRKKRWAEALLLIGAFEKKDQRKEIKSKRIQPIRKTRLNVWGDEVKETIGYYNGGTGEVMVEKRKVKWEIKDADKVEKD